MKFVIATAQGPEHTYVTHALADALGDRLAGVIVEQRPGVELSLSRLRKIHRRYGVLRNLERVATKSVRKLLGQDRRRDQALREIVGYQLLQLPSNCQLAEVASVNAPPSIDWLKKMAPDVLLVYGTSVIRKRALQTPSKIALNLHTGISPHYRGSGTVFWPLYNREPSMVGATVHECTANLDGGRIFSTVQAPLQDEDDPYSAFARAVCAGAQIYAQAARDLAGGADLSGQVQDPGVGREYFFRDLTFVQELVMEWRIRRGSLRRDIAASRTQ
jgi:methionyl-tRNA formyltransferase